MKGRTMASPLFGASFLFVPQGLKGLKSKQGIIGESSMERTSRVNGSQSTQIRKKVKRGPPRDHTIKE